jgi:hypothetical protein
MANLETARHYAATEAETNRANLAQEAIKRQEADTNRINAETRLKEFGVNKYVAKADVKLKKAQTKSEKKRSKLIGAQTKSEKAKSKNIKADTAKKKRETSHIDVVEAQENKKLRQKDIELNLKAAENAIKKAYNEGNLKLGKAKNENEKRKIRYDMLDKAFDNPAFLAYMTASGEITLQKAKKNANKLVKDLSGIDLEEDFPKGLAVIKDFCKKHGIHDIDKLTVELWDLFNPKPGGSATHTSSSRTKHGGGGFNFK